MYQNDIFYKRPDENALRWVKWGGVGDKFIINFTFVII